jgi:myo-inositol-1(or 4)-monophosphatase
MAAGALLVREAGGTVTTFDGAVHTLSHRRIVARNGRIHPAMLDVLRIAAGEGRVTS